MKIFFKSKIILFSIIFLILFSTLCFASDVGTTYLETSNEAVTTDISENEITATDTVRTDPTYEFIESDLYKFDTDITVNSIVDGNVFAFGSNISINGEIGGDVFAFGNNITIAENSYIHGSIFAFGKNITINGICYDVYATTQDFTLGSKAIIARDLRLAADRTNLNGHVKRDAYISTNELVFPDDAQNIIVGDLNYTSSTEFNIADSIVSGTIAYTPEKAKERMTFEIIISYVKNIISTLLYSLVVILLVLWLAPNFREKAGKLLSSKAPLSLGVGLLTSLIIIVGSFAILFITWGLGTGISVAIITMYILTLTISKTVFSMSTAKLIANKSEKIKNNNIIFVLLSLLVILVISILELIPFIGGLIGFILSMIGLGIIVLNIISKKELNNNKQEIINEKE